MNIGERMPEGITGIKLWEKFPYVGGGTPATGYSLSGPSGGLVGVASTNFTVALTPGGGAVAGTVIVTPSDLVAGGVFTPATVALTTASPSATFTYTPGIAGARTIACTNNGGLANPASLAYAASAPFAPTDLAGLQGWWKGDSFSGVTDGTQWVGWPDSSPSGKAMTGGCAAVGASAPYYSATGLNGKPCSSFPYYNLAAEIIAGGVTQAAPWTSFIVLKGIAGVNCYGIMMSNGWGSMGPSLHNGVYGWGASGYIWGAGSVDTAAHVLAVTVDSPTVPGGNRCYVDGAQLASTIITSGQSNSNFDRFGAFAGGNFGQGLIAEIIHYGVALSDTDRQKVENYLKNKYAITFPPPFVPTDIPGLKGYWAADSMSLTDGTPIDLWASSGGVANNATQVGAARPTFLNNVIQRDVKLRRLIPLLALGVLDNEEGIFAEAPELFTLGKPVVRFTSSAAQELLVATGIPDTTWTVIAVMRNLGALGASIGNDVAYGTFGPMWGFGSVQTGTAGVGYATTAINIDALFHVVCSDTSMTNVYLDGAAWPLSAPTGFGAGPTLNRIGRRFAQYGDQDIAELLVYDSVLSAANRNKVTNYLRCKYGL